MVACGEVDVLDLQSISILKRRENKSIDSGVSWAHRTNELKHGSNHKSKND